MRRERLLVLAVVGWLLMGINVLADVIKLRDGSVLKGKVVSFREQKFTIVVKIGGAEARYTIPLEEIESVEFGGDEEATAGEGSRAAARSAGAEPLAGRRPPVSVASPATESGGSGRRAAPEGAAPGDRELAGVGDTRTVLIEKKITVPAAADWTSSEIRVQRGQRIVINASGEIDLGNDRRAGPAGLKDQAVGLKEQDDARRPIPTMPIGGLIVVIGDDNDDYQFIGGSREFDAPHNGIIFLMVNERSPQDNSGSFVAQVKILSSR